MGVTSHQWCSCNKTLKLKLCCKNQNVIVQLMLDPWTRFCIQWARVSQRNHQRVLFIIFRLNSGCSAEEWWLLSLEVTDSHQQSRRSSGCQKLALLAGRRGRRLLREPFKGSLMRCALRCEVKGDAAGVGPGSQRWDRKPFRCQTRHPLCRWPQLLHGRDIYLNIGHVITNPRLGYEEEHIVKIPSPG